MRIDNFGASQYLGRVNNGAPAAYRQQQNISDAAKEQNKKQGQDNSLAALTDIGGIQSNVMKKAVSQMKMDSVLHEYQYFVGNAIDNNRNVAADSNILTNDEDGVVIRKN